MTKVRDVVLVRILNNYLTRIEYHGAMTVMKGSYADAVCDVLATEGLVTAEAGRVDGEVTYRAIEPDGNAISSGEGGAK